ncbi:lysophospholipase L1-like esterase [Frondihabitans sp. PhB188]|uniref:GDSL-type esterase/lipase family protein n=1 Tax=Frondihabitans sp. PhB188 TaxID=2485200 RepID=UPI000F4634F1|nr:GDSL-type esterase/lipase family protein [Frondihabitans sp. PhB188]ROQ36558.1 lysophospholipase L1-like esterase [Frondihabitans sp. PhB188]
MIPVDITPALLRGSATLEPSDRGFRLHRLPEWVRTRHADGQLTMVESQPSGVRVAFRTTATAVELTLHPTRVAYRGANRPRGVVDLLVDGALVARDTIAGGDAVEVDLTTSQSGFRQGEPHVARFEGLPADDKLVELWLPHNETVELVTVAADAPVRPDETRSPVWLHHGSSISHGSNAAFPSEIWPAIAARRAGVDLQSLGFGGSALVDPFMARVMRDTPADVISVKLGINVVNADAMRLRAFTPAVHGSLDTIRDGHPDTPLLLVSPLFCGIHESTPGPGAFDPASIGTDQIRFIATGDPAEAAAGRLTLEVIRRELEAVAASRSDDPDLHFLDGLDLFAAADAAELPLPDGLHPGPEAHRRIGERFADRAFGTEGPFERVARALSAK